MHHGEIPPLPRRAGTSATQREKHFVGAAARRDAALFL